MIKLQEYCKCTIKYQKGITTNRYTKKKKATIPSLQFALLLHVSRQYSCRLQEVYREVNKLLPDRYLVYRILLGIPRYKHSVS